MVDPGGLRPEVRSWHWPDAGEYGEHWAHDYDRLTGSTSEWTDAAVAALAKLAGEGTVLEVAAGTGRVAIPLARTGLDVAATDASPKMLEVLANKEGGQLPRTWVEVLPAVSGTNYSVIAILANSIWVLETADAQQEFLRNAAACLARNGTIVVEMTMADPTRWDEPRRLDRGSVTVWMSTVWNAETQQVRHTYRFPPGVHPPRRDVYVRYLAPTQLLTMAAAANLAPRHLWSDWSGTPFRPDSRMMIAILELELPGKDEAIREVERN